MKYRAIIIEDEELSRNRLRRLLKEYPEDIAIVAEADNGLVGVELIQSLNPDLLFLDINLPGLDGFQLLGNLECQPAVIFTTASNQHALEAFKTHAVDYLLKPIDPDALKRAVEKLRTMGFNNRSFTEAFERVSAAMGTQYQYLSRVTCKVGDRMFIVKTPEILYFQSDNKYTSVFTAEKQFLIDTPLVDLERKLNPKDFFRIHRGTIVNVHWIGEIRKSMDGKMKAVMLDKVATELSVSRMAYEPLREFLGA